MTVAAGIPAVLPQGFPVVPVVCLLENVVIGSVHVCAVFCAAIFTVCYKLLCCGESLLHKLVRAVLARLKACLCQHSHCRLLRRLCRRGVSSLLQPLCGKAQVGQYHLLIYCERLGARRREVHRGCRCREHGHAAKLLHGVEIIHCTHEAGFGNFHVPVGLGLERRTVCHGYCKVAGADTVVYGIPDVFCICGVCRRTCVEPHVLGMLRVLVALVCPQVGAALGQLHVAVRTVQIALHAEIDVVQQCLVSLKRAFRHCSHCKSAGIFF